ncbi:hypothetical protein pdam_00023843 [Pocillopora damicornis]|uniref:Uncharacterized protein n=1 Tax=Pocillopora damicornis TaxID=46731 RepID=A0A3M6TWC0_POCDA|nr:hypothetical protein pdam_00023843 [Pocillopora damicornis]
MSAKGIEEVKRLATKGLSGDEEAIKELGLGKVPEVTIPDFKEIDRFTVDKIKNVAAISFVVGKKVGLPLLEASAKNLYELVKFVEKDKLKTNTKPEMDRKIGNKESLRLIGLKRMPAVTIAPIKKVPNSMTLQCYYKRAHLIASTAEYMGNTTLRIVSQFMMAMCDVIARSHHPEEPELSADTDGQDVCETLNAEIEDIMRWVEHLAELRKKERADEEEEDDSDPAYSPELKSSHTQYRVHLKEAKRYTGIQELDCLLTLPSKAPSSKLTSPSFLTAQPNPREHKTNEDEEIEETQGIEETQEQEEEEEEEEWHPEGEVEESDEDSEDAPTIKIRKEEYYSATKFTSYRHQWLSGFFKYLKSPSAGYKKLENRLQHVGQVEKLLETLDPNGKDITILGEEFGDIVWNKWVSPHLSEGTKAPGTLASYLTSLEKFFVFVTSEKYKRKEMPPLHGNDFDVFKGTINALKGWRATIDNETQDVQHRTHLRECDTLLTETDINLLPQSKPYIDGMKAITQAKAGKRLSIQQFTNARDFLLVKLALLVASRPAPLENALLEDYQKAQEKDGNRVMLIPKH